MDGWQDVLVSVLSLSIGGVSIFTIIANVVYCVKAIAKNRKETKAIAKQMELNKTSIEEAFKNAVLPKTIKLDVSSKIEKPIKEGLSQIREDNRESLELIHKENVLILKVLNQFTHVKKLSEEDQEAIADIVNEEATEEVQL